MEKFFFESVGSALGVSRLRRGKSTRVGGRVRARVRAIAGGKRAARCVRGVRTSYPCDCTSRRGFRRRRPGWRPATRAHLRGAFGDDDRVGTSPPRCRASAARPARRAGRRDPARAPVETRRELLQRAPWRRGRTTAPRRAPPRGRDHRAAGHPHEVAPRRESSAWAARARLPREPSRPRRDLRRRTSRATSSMPRAPSRTPAAAPTHRRSMPLNAARPFARRCRGPSPETEPRGRNNTGGKR